MERGFITEPEDIEPDIGPFEFYFDAFRELSSCRTSGMAVGPIPFTAIVAYSTLYSLEDFDEFRYVIRRMDDFFISEESKKAEKKETNGKNSTGSTNKNPN